jgi:hypothetical protein
MYMAFGSHEGRPFRVAIQNNVLMYGRFWLAESSPSKTADWSNLNVRY